MPSPEPTPVQALIHQLGNDTAADALAATAVALAEHSGDPAAEHLAALLGQDHGPLVRDAVIEALARIFAARPPTIAEVAIAQADGYHDRRPFHRALQRALTRTDAPEALSALFVALENAPDIDDVTWLLDRVAATGRFTNEQLSRALEETRDLEHRGFLAGLLARREVDEGHALLLEAGPRVYGDRLLARGADGIRLLCRLGDAFEPYLQEQIAERLAALRGKTEPTIREILRDLATPGAATAAHVLGYFDEIETAETLLAIARSSASPRKARDAALEALCQLEAPEAVQVLCDALSDTSAGDYTRWTCADALAVIGDPAALPALERAARDYATDLLGQHARDAIAHLGKV